MKRENKKRELPLYWFAFVLVTNYLITYILLLLFLLLVQIYRITVVTSLDPKAEESKQNISKLSTDNDRGIVSTITPSILVYRCILLK